MGLSVRQRLGTGNNNGTGSSGVVNRLSIKGAAGNQQAQYSIKGEGGPYYFFNLFRQHLWSLVKFPQ